MTREELVGYRETHRLPRLPARGSEAEWDLALEDHYLDEMGLLDPDEPTRYGSFLEAHRLRDLLREFTSEERRQIRWHLGLGEQQP